MKKKNYSGQIYDAVENYYQYNPDTLMPLLMLALAAQGKLRISNKSHKKNKTFCAFLPKEVIQYDWVQLDPALKKRIKQAIDDNYEIICAEGELDKSLNEIYETFYINDTKTVVQEYHHRIGLLVHHSSNEASDQAHRQYATLCLAEALIETPNELLQDQFMDLANHVLVKSGLQPKRPRMQVASVLTTLLKYDGSGVVYNPFAGCAMAAIMTKAGSNLYADADINPNLFAAARLLNYGIGGSNEHIKQHDSTQWIKGVKTKYVISTYRGYIKGKSAFDFCLSKCLDTLPEDGRYAGVVSPKDIFETQSEEMKEALRRDWLETIVLMPNGEVAVLINAKKDKSMKNKVRFFDLTHTILNLYPVTEVLRNEDNAIVFPVSDIKKKHFLRNFILPDLPVQDGFEIVTLSSFVKRIKRQTYSLVRVPKEERVLAYIDRTAKYNQFVTGFDDIEKKAITSLFAPAYHLVNDSLITNSQGVLEPRLFDSFFGSAYFQDGFAFELNPQVDREWLINQLNEPYVLRQLHPYGLDEMVPEPITEEQILNLKLYREIEVDNDDHREDDRLQMGHVLYSENHKYTIHNFLGNGNFGFAYSAESQNLATGEKKEVVLKEFYPHNAYHRENGKIVLDCEWEEETYIAEKCKFKKEFEIMQLLGNITDSHIVPALDFFESDETDTMYYVMPFYEAKSLDDFLKRGDSMTEKMAIEHVVIPMCKALHTSEVYKILHLDIKPENILVDSQGNAVLTDFGTAKIYNEEGDITDRRGMHSTSCFAPPELIHGSMTTYDPRPDMFGIAATVYSVVTRSLPFPIMELGKDEENEIRCELSMNACSEQFINALVKGLQGSMSLRPENAQAFINLFPGCENIKL